MTVQQNHNFTSPLRYPGGKGSITNFVKLILAQNSLLDGEYVEVYGGGAAIAWSLLFDEYVQRVHVNDISPALMAFWQSATLDTEEFCRLINDTDVTIQEWHRQRAVQQSPQGYSRLQLGFSTFFLNRTNRSGILNGGVIGGKAQNGTWKLDARFHKADLIKRIQRIARYSNRIRLYSLDGADFIRTVLPLLPRRTLVYLDPPYYHKGQELYENHYDKADHAMIADLVINSIQQPWLVSYDAAPEIMALYPTQRHICYNINYSAQDRYAGSEVIFISPQLKMPQVEDPKSVKAVPHTRPLL